MTITGKTSQPIGHYEFCQRNSEECQITNQSFPPLKLNAKNWALLKKINQDINQQITPVNDIDFYGVEEYWSYADDAGDCEDYVLDKQRALNRKGIPLANLLITVVRQPNGEGHAVLTVHTDQGDLILDSLRDEIYDWKDTEYTFLKRQSAEFSGEWQAIEQQGDITITAVSAH